MYSKTMHERHLISFIEHHIVILIPWTVAVTCNVVLVFLKKMYGGVEV
jgi:hypothetical protein